MCMFNETQSRMYRIEDKEMVIFADAEKRKQLECHICGNLTVQPRQTKDGNMFCLKCVKDHYDDDTFLDIRLKNRTCQLVAECEANRKGCGWIGKLKDYKPHILNDCMFTTSECAHCERVVCMKDIKAHRVSPECMDEQKKVVSCRSGCGYTNQKWLMTSHVTRDCPKTTPRCVFGNECRSACSDDDDMEHWMKCVSKNLEGMLHIHEKKIHEKIKIQCADGIHIDEETITFFEMISIQNKEKFLFSWRIEKNQNRFIVMMQLHDGTKCATTMPELLKNTLVTVSLVNQNKKRKRNDDESHNYVRILPLYKCDAFNVLFYEHDFIHVDKMLPNKETGTCYITETSMDVVIDMWFPCAATFKH